ncbi:uncharacterized protein PG986_009327 [Apiospora aurea]|uniref:Uncharacterized protein n=1 Tax=Apiospora aurea TaxID=335848 RepID=A0ABR1Q7B9_9PEZI
MCRMVIFTGSCIKCGRYFTWTDLTQELPCLEAKNAGECDACAEDEDEGVGDVDTNSSDGRAGKDDSHRKKKRQRTK